MWSQDQATRSSESKKMWPRTRKWQTWNTEVKD